MGIKENNFHELIYNDEISQEMDIELDASDLGTRA